MSSMRSLTASSHAYCPPIYHPCMVHSLVSNNKCKSKKKTKKTLISRDVQVKWFPKVYIIILGLQCSTSVFSVYFHVQSSQYKDLQIYINCFPKFFVNT